jgi:DNA-binding beta-propeller fold protein YncE
LVSIGAVGLLSGCLDGQTSLNAGLTAGETSGGETSTQPSEGDNVEGLGGSSNYRAYVLSEYESAVNVVDGKTKKVIFKVTAPGSLNRPHRAWVHPSQKRLFVSNKAGGKLLAFDISNPSVAPTLAYEVLTGTAELHNIQITGASTTAVDGLVWVTNAGKPPAEPSFVGAFNAADLSLVTKVTAGVTKAHGMLMRPGTNELWFTNRPSQPWGNVTRIDTITRQTITTPTMNLPLTMQADDQPNNVAFARGGADAYVVIQGDDLNQNVPTLVSIVDANTFTLKMHLQLDPLMGRRPHALTYDEAHKYMWVCTRLGGAAVVIDTANLPVPRVITYIPVGTECHDVSLSPDGRYAYTSTLGGPGVSAPGEGRPYWEDNVKIIDTDTLQVVKTLPISSHAINFSTP